MTEKSTTTFTCDGCETEQEGANYVAAPLEWRRLRFEGGYAGDKTHEAHFCPKCWPSRLKAINVLLETKGEDVFA